MDFEFQEEDSDVMMRLQGEDGHELTLITAPASTFDDPEDLGPNVYGLGDQIVVAFNEELRDGIRNYTNDILKGQASAN